MILFVNRDKLYFVQIENKNLAKKRKQT